MDLQHGRFSVKMHANTKELGPIGEGVCPARLPPRSANGEVSRSYRLCYTAASPLHVLFPIDLSCVISKVLLIDDKFISLLVKKYYVWDQMMMELCTHKRIRVFVERICIKY